jgi:hypothetical protein
MTVAMLNRIDPRALIGSILAANTINSNPADKVINQLPSFLKSALPKQGKFYGIGKISINAAMEIETSAYPKKWDPTASSGRPTAEVQKALTLDRTALMTAGQYVRYGQEVYAKNNWPIDEKPEVIATLYSMGKIEDRIAATLKAGREPKINDWGVLVACNANVIQTILADAKSLKGSLSEGGCIYAPASAKVTDWKFRCLKADGTFKMDISDSGAASGKPPVQSLGTGR